MSLLLSTSLSALGTRGQAGGAAALLRFACRAERAGVDFLVIRGPADTLIAASWLIPATRRIGLVCCVPATDSQPFHTARALAAMDTLSGGRMGWLPSTAGERELSPAYGTAAATAMPHAKAAEYVDATQALWDSWDADALIVDKDAAIYLDSSKIRRIDYRGQYFRVMGPLNAARPPQGYPVLVRESTDPDPTDAQQTADVVLVAANSVADAQERVAGLRASGVKRIFVKVCCGATVNAAAGAALVASGDAMQIALQLVEWQEILGCDGIDIVGDEDWDSTANLFESLSAQLRGRVETDAVGAGADRPQVTLRARLRLPLPINRYSP